MPFHDSSYGTETTPRTEWEFVVCPIDEKVYPERKEFRTPKKKGHKGPRPPNKVAVADLSLLPNAGLADITILAADESGTAGLHRWIGEVWETNALTLPYSSILRVVRSGDHLTLAAYRDDRISLFVERGRSLLPLADFKPPEGRWGLASSGDALLLLAVDGSGDLTVRSIDPLRGVVGEAQPWVRPPLKVSSWLQLPIIGMLVVAALIAIVLFRPSEAADTPLRAGVVPLPLPRRLLALAIDFVPGLVVALAWFGPEQLQPSAVPFSSTDLAFAGPGMTVIGITLFHELLGEMVWRRSLGKFIMGGAVLSADGSRAGVGSVLLRNLFKAVVLYAPILAVFVVLSPSLQGVPETVSRTVVADRRQAQKTPDGE